VVEAVHMTDWDGGRAVLEATLTLFAERGYHGTAVSQIAVGPRIRTLR
jgi:Bacterial regulatory proteins, tetR family